MLRKLTRLIYNLYCVFWFVFIFLVLFPFIFVCIQFPFLHRYGTKLTNFWADIFFIVVGMPVNIVYKTKLSPHHSYVFVANHFSYLDVAVGMKVVRHYFSYMGKSSVKKIPLLGYMFAKLHIQVDRSDGKSRAKSLLKSKAVLAAGRSLFIMPEGGIISKSIPVMQKPFKDGAFLLAIEAQVPIVPISFMNLHKIMPDTSLFWGIPKVVVHAPVSTKGLTKFDMEALKEQVYAIIQGEITQPSIR
jgi:1-acyl-sn-glycerol-3-phosphate acyltransferase